jgi:FkbM family methyltransferase
MNHYLDATINAYIAHYPPSSSPIVWDVGSRDGDDGFELAQRIAAPSPTTHATVVCVEANPAQAAVIRSRYPQATVYELAASDTSGSAPFVVYQGDEGAVGSSSLDLRWKAHDHLPHYVIEVPTERLDALIGSEVIDIMKIDVEGHSLQVLHGLGDRLRQVRVFHIETETWTHSDEQVRDYMAAHGFRLVDESIQWANMPDLVFVNEML